VKVIGIIGTRRRVSTEDYKLVLKAVRKVVRDDIQFDDYEIVSGGCPEGGDQFAEIIAKKYQITIKIHYAKWNKYGKSAGFRRNIFIAKDADILIACVSEDRKGGTEDTISKYKALGKTELIIV
jgi:hypothetical protein